jgi:hypothetical protein
VRGRARQILAYVAAPVLIGLALLVRRALVGEVQDPQPDLFLMVVAVVGLLGGRGPALLATGIAFLEEVYFVAEPVEVPGNWGDVPGVGR